MKHDFPKRPREPAPSDCCGSGCTRCVWDVYFDEMMKYEERMQNTVIKDEFADGDVKGGCDSSSDDSDGDGVSSNYVGSVVVKYIDIPNDEGRCVTAATSISTILGRFSDVVDVHTVSSSSRGNSGAHSPVGNQDIHVLDVVLGETDGFEKLKLPLLPLPGDVVEIFRPNDYSVGNCEQNGEVEKLCDRLGVSPNQWCELYRSPFVPTGHFPPWLPLQQPVQIRTLLAYFVDIGSCSYILRPTFLQTLFRVATSVKGVLPDSLTPESRDMLELLKVCGSSEVAPLIYKATVSGNATPCFPRLIDVLNVFSFVNFPLARLLEVSGPLRARKFSVANYTLSETADRQGGSCLGSVQLCLRGVDVAKTESAVEKECTSEPAHIFAGLLRGAALRRCTEGGNGGNHFTGHVSNPLCYFHSRQHALRLYVGTKLFGMSSFAKNLNRAITPVRLSTGLSPVPTMLPWVILVGAGTGIAPLMSAVNELVRRRADGSAVERCSTKCWVVYGARNFSELVYHEQLQEALRLGAISRYEVALSRSTAGEHPRYVTDVLESHAEFIRSELLERSGWMFACGPLSAMRSLRERMTAKILRAADDDESVSEQRIRYLEGTEHLVFDIWGSVGLFS